MSDRKFAAALLLEECTGKELREIAAYIEFRLRPRRTRKATKTEAAKFTERMRDYDAGRYYTEEDLDAAVAARRAARRK